MLKKNFRKAFLVFDLHVGYQHGRFIKCVSRSDFLEKYSDFDGRWWTYRWSDGHVADVSCTVVDADEVAEFKKTAAPCSYDWMIDSILQFGEILKRQDW